MGKKILIIEDTVRMSNLLKLYLEKEAYQIDIYDNGEKGLSQALKNHYDLIIINLFVKGMDGFKVLEELRKKKTTPVYMISAICGGYNKKRSLMLGATEYILMPFSPREIILKVKKQLAPAPLTPRKDMGTVLLLA